MHYFFGKFSVLLFLLCSLNGLAQNREPNVRVSALTRQFLSDWEMGFRPGPGIIHPYVFHRGPNGSLLLRGFIKTNAAFSEKSLEALGALTGSKVGSVRTLSIPPENVRKALRLPGILAFDADQAGYADMDSARVRTRVDSIHAGINLPRRFAGDSIVVGIIDAGFDYTHPVLYDTAYQNYRVKRVWEQKGLGSAPTGFPYGAEYSDSAAIHTKAFDVTETTHGTHVAGIAAGGGFQGPVSPANRYRGLAYASDLVLVAIYPTPEYWLNTGMTDFLDGIRYTFAYGQSQGRPAVANLSWGCPLGPRDGSSLFSQACDSLTGPGKIFVVSGGNNGANRIHTRKVFTPSDSLFNTFTTFPTSLTEKRNQIDIWGDSGQVFQLQISLYSGAVRLAASPWISLDDSTHRIGLQGSNFDSLFATVSAVAREFNDKPHMLLQLFDKTGNRVCLTLKSKNGTVHLWQGIVVKTSGHYGIFTRYTYNWATEGDVAYTCGDLVSTRSAIAVGAYNTKVAFTNVSGQALSYQGYVRGRIASFSSQGPTVDGRSKPDIAAPGMALASGVSSYDPEYQQGGADFDVVVRQFPSLRNGRTYGFGMAGGTSMAAPCVSGIAALLLQQNPELSPQSLMALFAQTAIRDNATGIIPPQGSNTWGYGKVNAYRAMKTLLLPTQTFSGKKSEEQVRVFPNPGKGLYRVRLPEDWPRGPVFIRVFGPEGKQIQALHLETEPGLDFDLPLSTGAPGIFSVDVRGADRRASFRLIQEDGGK